MKKKKKLVSLKEKLNVFYIDPNCSGIQVKECSSKKELKKFLADDDEELCPNGETLSYVVVEGASQITPGSIDRT